MWTPTPPACGIALLQRVEAFKPKAYPDPGGIPTIAYGHTQGVKLGDTCTIEQGAAWLAEDCAWAWRAVQKHVEVPLNENQAGALLSFVFNLGETDFASSTLLKRLNQAFYSDVPRQMAVWIYEKIDGVEQESTGLRNRRAQEIALWNQPVE